MNYILILILAFVKVQATEPVIIFEADFSKYETQFMPFQKFRDPESPNPITLAEVIIENNQKVLSFPSEPTTYTGVITTDWIESPSGNYYITVEFKGTADQRTGAYIGYISDDDDKKYKTIGLDADLNMDNYQVYRFNKTGTWNTYIAYLSLPQENKIKIIIEKGAYFGIKKNYNARFRKLKVRDFTFTNACDDQQQRTYQLGYITFLFFINEIQNKFNATSTLELTISKSKFQFNQPSFVTPCLKTSFFGVQSDGKVIEKFVPVLTNVNDLISTNVDIYNNYEFSFIMNDIETLGCASQNMTCKDNKNCTKYTCDYQEHFYYNKDYTFNTKQAEYDYTTRNSQLIFKSQFTVIVYQENSTILQNLIKTWQIYNGICQINTDMTLILEIQTPSSTTYTTPSDILTVLYGDYIKFRITSTPSDYELELMKVVVTTGTETIQLDEMFISSYIQNMDQNVPGQLTFEMRISEEAGIPKSLNYLLKQLLIRKNIYFAVFNKNYSDNNCFQSITTICINL